MKTCPECQAQIRDAARICRECGHLFPADPPLIPTRPGAPPRRRENPRRRAVALVSANPWRTAALALLALLVISIVIANVGGGGDAKAKPKTLAVSLEKKFSGQLERVEQDLRPVMSEQGAEGTAYRVEEGSTSCREQDGRPSYLCLVWLVDGEGTRFSLAYALTSTDDGCWEATPERAQLADGRPMPIDPAKLPPLDYCLSPSADEEEASPACDPSYPDFCIPPSPPDRNCADLSQTDFTVKTEEGDSHGFDRDRDGKGCERGGAPNPKDARPALLPSDCLTPVERPGKVIVACADADFYIEGIRWRAWGEDPAVGEGTAMAKECDPSCAEGQFKAYPGVTIHASRLRPCPNGNRQYTALTYAFSGESPFPPDSPGATDTTVPMPCPGHGEL